MGNRRIREIGKPIEEMDYGVYSFVMWSVAKRQTQAKIEREQAERKKKRGGADE